MRSSSLLYVILSTLAVSALLITSGWAQAPKLSSISKAYVKELSFLKAQKQALESRVTDYQASSQERLKRAQGELKALEGELLRLQRGAMKLEEELQRSEQQALNLDRGDESAATLSQARQVLETLGLSLAPLPEDPSAEALQASIRSLTVLSLSALERGTQVTRHAHRFFDERGVESEGEVIEVGRVSRLGALPSRRGGALSTFAPLAPAGQGHFKVWPVSEAEDLFGASDRLSEAFEGGSPTLLPVVLYESAETSMEKKVSKTWRDELKAGGSVGYVIVGLGALAFSFAFWRLMSLILLGRSFNDARVRAVFESLGQAPSGAQATPSLDELAMTLKPSRMVSRILRSTLLGLNQGGRSLGEEYGFEQLLKEQGRLERFGTLIMVSASIAPLLGLLGTVSGMIATFDIITEFGTGDPRLLSGGISEALVTTRLGLIVAIPTLFLGTLLNGHSQRLANRAQIKMLELLNAWDLGRVHAVDAGAELISDEPQS